MDRNCPALLRIPSRRLLAGLTVVWLIAAASGAMAATAAGASDDGKASTRGSSTLASLAGNSPCDDGRACTVNDAYIGGTCVGTPTDSLCAVGLPPLVCYAARPAAGQARFVSRASEVVLDAFSGPEISDEDRLAVKEPTALCGGALGVSKEDDVIFLESYLASSLVPRAGPHKVLRVENELEVISLWLQGPDRLLVPSGVSTSQGRAPRAPDGRSNRWKCYTAISASQPTRKTIWMPDPIATGTPLFEVGTLQRLCTREIVHQQETPALRGGFLTCYEAKLARTFFPQPKFAASRLSTHNLFGREGLTALNLSEICLPAVARPQVPQEDAPFAFLIETGLVNDALRTIWEQNRIPALTTEAANAAWAVRANAEVVVRMNLPEVRRILLSCLQQLTPNDADGHIALAALLATAGSDAGIRNHMRSILMAPPPQTLPAHDETPSNAIVRQVFLGHVASAARNGDTDARDLVRELVASPDPTVQTAAVRTYYAVAPDRRAAQRIMRSLLSPSSRYLLYVD